MVSRYFLKQEAEDEKVLPRVASRFLTEPEGE